ncbi:MULTISPECIES: VanW family protein [Bacillus]|uniref:VanW family protein n=1 Tax=Bacillus TaxID=1386 RepID=UPI000363B8E7|nr:MULTISPECIES: VanW family protein [Bacillus]PEP50275.1 vancomycin resistance protein [Bacillus pseudomycoides]PGS07534.1 vancomycin resistance protein [Bacillus pseudomycoides]PHC81815.1 vancomycin resistance protein [Bacillus pseudomycoides]
MNEVNIRPKKRSKYRIMLGTWYYSVKRNIQWLTDGKKYAKTFQQEKLPCTVIQHRTILFRKLKDVDMWYQENKIINLKIAIKQLNGVVIKPGETFSYWRLIGKTTKRKGYVEGMVLHYGTFKPGVGGGLCQLSNLIYWMTLHTTLTVTERYRHSYDVFPDSKRTQPFGSGATCSYNYLDLQIKNETDQAYQLHLYVTDEHLVGEWRTAYPQLYQYEVYEKEHAIKPAYWGGYIRCNVIHRRAFNQQKQFVEDQYVTGNHAIMMYEPLLAYSSGKSEE